MTADYTARPPDDGTLAATEHRIDTLQGLAYFLYSPLTWLLPVMALLAARWSRLRRWLRALLCVALAALLLLCTPLGANLLVHVIERQVPPSPACRLEPVPLVVLSGGFDRAPLAAGDYTALSVDSWRRLRRGVEEQRARGPDGLMWVSGGGPFAVKEGDVLGALARDWGVPDAQLRIERESTTTWDSAKALRAGLPPRILLASSALHLPRAMVAFRAAGFSPCALPTDTRYVAPRSLTSLIPQASAVQKSDDAIYELLGNAYYRLRAMSEASPADPAATAR